MRWGVRKDRGYSIKLGSDGSLTILSGSNIHRISSTDKESDTGHVYAAFTEKDVQHYRHSVTSWITESADGFDSAHTFDMSMKVTKDLIAPSEKKKIDTFIKLLDSKMAEEIQKQYVINIDGSDGNQQRRFETLSKKLQTSGMDERLSDFYSAFSLGLNYSDELRTRFFNELKKDGYNMIVDTEDSLLEAQAPIIVFERKNNLKVLKTTPLPKKWSAEWQQSRVDENLSNDPTWNEVLKKTKFV